MQRGTPIDTHDLRGLLKFLLAGSATIFIFIASFFLVAAPGRSLLPLPGKRLAATSSSAALPARLPGTVLGPLLVAPFILGTLLFDKLFDLPAVLKVMALGAVNLAVLLAGSF